MRIEGRRRSANVEDRRGMSGGGKATLGGLGGLVVVGLIAWLSGGNPLEAVIGQLAGGGGIGGTGFGATETYTPSAEESAMSDLAHVVLAGTEDVWTEIFSAGGRSYEPPRMVLFSGATTSGCGNASSATGPFYCPADQTVYIDLSFFNQMAGQLGAGGDFAYAYVIAHEVGHHVQYLLGTLGEVSSQQRRMNEAESNRLNVRLELQADFFAGVWAFHDDRNWNSLEEGDVDEALNAASQIGDDRLQMRSQGYTVPDSFNHGTSAQRSRWLKRGLATGDVASGDTFSIPWSSL
jgi:predicted metalloprotease